MLKRTTGGGIPGGEYRPKIITHATQSVCRIIKRRRMSRIQNIRISFVALYVSTSGLSVTISTKTIIKVVHSTQNTPCRRICRLIQTALSRVSHQHTHKARIVHVEYASVTLDHTLSLFIACTSWCVLIRVVHMLVTLKHINRAARA